MVDNEILVIDKKNLLLNLTFVVVIIEKKKGHKTRIGMQIKKWDNI